MTFREKITGSDMNKQFEKWEQHISEMPSDYQQAWKTIISKLAYHADFSGRNIMPLLESVYQLLVEMDAQGKTIDDIFGGSIENFCHELTSDLPNKSVRDKWRRKLNKRVARKLK